MATIPTATAATFAPRVLSDLAVDMWDPSTLPRRRLSEVLDILDGEKLEESEIPEFGDELPDEEMEDYQPSQQRRSIRPSTC